MHQDAVDLMYGLLSQPLNPSSVHTNGRKAKNIIERARTQIKELLCITPHSRKYIVIFTSTGTEANNLILSNYRDGAIFISAIEHLSIFAQQNRYHNITTISVDSNCIIDLENLECLLSKSTNTKKLLSVMFANNETGAIQPLKDIIKIARRFDTAVHCDCVQAIGKTPISITDFDFDFITISGHKFGGPVGAAALIAKTNYNIVSNIIGGGQEMGLRAGTENIAAIAGLGLAASIAQVEMQQRIQHMRLLQQRLESNLKNIFPEIMILSAFADRIPNTSLISLPGMLSSLQLIALDLRHIAVSAGSACSSGKINKSHVLQAMGVDIKIAESAIRISTSQYNLKSDIDCFINAFKEIRTTYN